MTVGNIGSEFHRDYTVIGNQVNVAARLESMAKPGEILVSQRTYTKAKDVATFEEAGKVHLNQKKAPVAHHWKPDYLENPCLSVIRKEFRYGNESVKRHNGSFHYRWRTDCADRRRDQPVRKEKTG
jgi:hypothetical protein